MFTKYKPQQPLNVEGYCVVLHERRKSQEIKCIRSGRKDNIKPKT